MEPPHPRGQGGFALGVVLILVLMTALTLGALFGLMNLTIKTTKQSEVTARESRAADAAVEAALAQVREDPDSCVQSSQAILTDHVFDQGTPFTTDDVKVSVDCESIGGSGASADQVRIIGTDGYQGDVEWATDCSGFMIVPACTPWSSTLGGLPVGLATSKPGLVHTGPESLLFNSGVTVRTGAAILGSSGGGVEPKPALAISGEYSQGDPGLRLGGAADGGPGDCGILGTLSSPTLVVDADGAPSCGDAAAQAVPSDPTGSEAEAGLPVTSTPVTVPTTCATDPVVLRPGLYNSAKMTALNALLDGSKPDCRNKTFWFSPDTVVPSSDNHGVYSFDGTLKLADPGSAYVFGAPLDWDPSSGGAPAVTAAPGAASAPLCDRNVNGSSMVLSANSGISHTGGRLSVCPSLGPSGQPYPALYQTTSVPSVVTLTAAGGMTHSYTCTLTASACDPKGNYNFSVSSSGTQPLRSLRVMLTGTEGDTTQNNFVNKRQVRFIIFPPKARPTDGDPTPLCNTGLLDGTPNGGFTLAYELVRGDCAAKLKAMTASGLDGYTIRAVVTFNMTPLATQKLTITDAAAQVNAMVGEVNGTDVSSSDGSWNVIPSGGGTGSGMLAQPAMSCERVICKKALPSPVEYPSVSDHVRRFTMDIGGGFTFPGLSDFTDKGIDPRIQSLRFDVDVATEQKSATIAWLLGTLTLQPKNFRADLKVALEITTPNGNRCVSHGNTDGSSGVNGGSSGEVQRVSFSIDTIDDLADGAAPGDSCTYVIRSFDELTDPTTSIRLIFDVPCARNPDGSSSALCFQEPFVDLQEPDLGWSKWHDHIFEVHPPSVDRIAVYATTDSYAGPPSKSQIAIDAGATEPRMARVMGMTWLPLTDLDIHWLGDGGTAMLFNNDLVLHGLGSDMVPTATTAPVCCGRPSGRVIRLRARIDGRTRLVATVQISDMSAAPGGGTGPGGDDDAPGGTGGLQVSDPGATVRVLDWRRGRLINN